MRRYCRRHRQQDSRVSHWSTLTDIFSTFLFLSLLLILELFLLILLFLCVPFPILFNRPMFSHISSSHSIFFSPYLPCPYMCLPLFLHLSYFPSPCLNLFLLYQSFSTPSFPALFLSYPISSVYLSPLIPPILFLFILFLPYIHFIRYFSLPILLHLFASHFIFFSPSLYFNLFICIHFSPPLLFSLSIP